MNRAYRSAQKGFTLIELMIVVAIIGILAAIAIPQYQTYVAKSQVARVVSETGSQKTAVEDCVLNGKLTTGTAATACGGTATGSNLLKKATGNTVNGDKPADANLGAPVLGFTGTDGTSSLTSTLGGSAAAPLTDKKIVWSRDTAGTWTCATDVDTKYRSAGCTADAP